MAVFARRTLLVLGGSSGIGFATARLAATLGADVVLASHDRERLETAAPRIEGRARTELADLSDERSIAALCERLGRIDQLVVSGDQPHAGTIAELDIDDAKRGFDVKFWGSIRAVKHAAPRMPPDGSIVLISGVLAVRPAAGMVTLAALNAAIEGLVRGLAVELSPISGERHLARAGRYALARLDERRAARRDVHGLPRRDPGKAGRHCRRLRIGDRDAARQPLRPGRSGPSGWRLRHCVSPGRAAARRILPGVEARLPDAAAGMAGGAAGAVVRRFPRARREHWLVRVRSCGAAGGQPGGRDLLEEVPASGIEPSLKRWRPARSIASTCSCGTTRRNPYSMHSAVTPSPRLELYFTLKMQTLLKARNHSARCNDEITPLSLAASNCRSAALTEPAHAVGGTVRISRCRGTPTSERLIECFTRNPLPFRSPVAAERRRQLEPSFKRLRRLIVDHNG